MANQESEQRLELVSVDRKPVGAAVEQVTLHTSEGDIDCVLHLSQAAPRGAVVWVGGAGGGLFGPAGGLYARLSEKLAPEGVTSLRLDYRAPNDFVPCVLDTMIGALFLQTLDPAPLILVGHSFGGAVVITAAALNDEVVGVAALASQTAGTELVEELGLRSIFLAHGKSDRVLPERCSIDISNRVSGPKDMHLYPGCGHNFDECGTQLEQDLQSWLEQQFHLV